ncbi:MAG: ISL3 family transposase [Armatimonadota bacterium]
MAHALLPDPKTLALDNITVQEGIITFHIRTTATIASCPECGFCSERVHGRYRRTLQDLPWQGNAVRFLLTVRRFFCGNAACKRKIFAEEPVSVARRYRRKTSRLDDLLLQLVWKVGGESAAAIARLVGLLLSPDAALYRIKKSAQNTLKESPEVLGIDDFAFRKGHTYGTILIDLRTSTPVDLLPDREKTTVEKWLKEHPGAKVVSRDRSATFAEAIRAGAPEAVHVADRFHLLKNLMEVLEKQVSKESKAIAEALLPKEASWEDAGLAPLSRFQQERKEVTRQKRFDLWQKAHELFAQGHAKKEVARQTGLNVRTVRGYLRSATFPERQRYAPVSGPLDPFKDYLVKRWEEDCHNALELFREIKAQGFPGGATAVRDFVRPFRDPNLPPAVLHAKRSIPAPSSLAWLLVLPDRNSPKQKELVDKLCAALPVLPQCRDLVLSFQDILRRRAKDELDDWLDRAKASELPAFVTFVRGIRADYAAVKAAFSLEWSNGPVEGHVNRLKFIKRQGYGSASFDLLKRRVLPLIA